MYPGLDACHVLQVIHQLPIFTTGFVDIGLKNKNH
jgi:hypothetical protein